MKITNKVDDDTLQAFGCKQWIEQFVKNVINQAWLECEEVAIEKIEQSKNISLSIDNRKYNVRTWNFQPVKRDENNNVCAEMVDYTLFEIIKDANGKHSNEISNGTIRINCKN